MRNVDIPGSQNEEENTIMNGKNLRIVGIVSSIIGFIITAFGVYKYEEAKGMVKALGQGSALFGSTDSTYRSEAIWLSSMNNYRIVIIVGAIILVVGIILLISGIINLKKETAKIENVEVNVSTNGKMMELKAMLDNGLITSDEFEMKKKELLDKM